MTRLRKRWTRWPYDKRIQAFDRIGILVLTILLISCASQPARYGTGMAVAVWDLDDYSPSKEARPNLGELLSGKVIQTLQERGLSVVERTRLLLALEELRLGTSSFVDEATRLKLGKMVGAQWMVFGGYQVIGGTMRLDLRLVEVESGKIKKAIQKTTITTDLQGWLSTAQKAARELL